MIHIKPTHIIEFKPIYSDEDQALIDLAKRELRSYENLLMARLESRQGTAQSTLEIDVHKRFMGDPYRLTLAHLVSQAYSMAVPIRFVCTVKNKEV